MKIRHLLEQIASDVAFAEADTDFVPEARLTRRRGQCLVACNAAGISGNLRDFAFNLAERIWCDLLMVCVDRCETGEGRLMFPTLAGPAPNLTGASVSYMRLHGEFFPEVHRLCSGNRRLSMAVLQCAAKPPVSFRLEVPYFLFT